MVKTKNLIIGTAIILVCSSVFLILLAGSSVPIFSVKELMDHPNPESYLNHKIQLVGIVEEINQTGFFIIDPEDSNNVTLRVYINSTNIEKPIGFELNKTVLIEGKLLSITSIWEMRAARISTKCPSKYQS